MSNMINGNNLITGIPNYGFKVKLNHVYPEKRRQNNQPKFRQSWPLLPLALRYLLYVWRIYRDGRQPLMNYLRMPTGQQIYGVPIGGIGSGSIGRGYRGEFCRFQLRPGIYEYNTVDADQFIVTIQDSTKRTLVQSVLSTYKKTNKNLKSWKWLIDGSKCNYTGLYPRSWTEFDLSQYGIKLICRQISPVIPHNYKDSSIPCAVFVWTVKNLSKEVRHVTITFSFKNGTKNCHRKHFGECTAESFSTNLTEGILLKHHIQDMLCTYVLSVRSNNDISITKLLYFDPSNGSDLWNDLFENGCFERVNNEKTINQNEEAASAIAAQIYLNSNISKDIEMCLVWHMPEVHFTKKGRSYLKFYTKYFGNDSETPINLVDYIFDHYEMWEKAIFEWQNPVLCDSDLPSWYKSAIFNELYFISDGGTVWFIIDESESALLSQDDPRLIYGRFAYLEGQEYRMYNTYDVHFYASYALVMCWPQLQVTLQYDFRDSIFTEMKKTRVHLYNGKVEAQKIVNTVPHDLGDPDEEPFLIINAYPIHNVSEWRDLNTKFVLQVFRDYSLKAGELKYLQDMYPACKCVMKRSTEFDTDGDGLIENRGCPDQTFDSWVMKGPSAYCAGLWLAALHCMVEMATLLNYEDDKKQFLEILQSGKSSFDDKLWQKTYYKFDSSGTTESESIMSDQLCGHWYLRSCGFNYEVFPKEKVQSALKTIYENNVMKFCNGKMGAVNGFLPSGTVDDITIQSEEVWTGVTYALAATFLFEGMETEAWQTAGGMFKSITEQIGMAFETPEALYATKFYRAIGYMRPLSIWSMQLAWEKKKYGSVNK